MIEKFIETYSLRGNWIDLVFISLVLFFAFTSKGFIESLFELCAFLLSLFGAYQFYDIFGRLLEYNFSFSHGIANALGFFISWFITESIIYFIITMLLTRVFVRVRTHKLNKTVAFLPAVIYAGIIFLFFVSLTFSLPVRGWIKKDILQSKTGPFFVNQSQNFEKSIKHVFGKAVSESLNFLTIKPRSHETLDLGFKLPENQFTYDTQSEKILVDLVNKERKEQGLSSLKNSVGLRNVSRDYALEMFTHGFFSHVSQVDGSSALERAQRAGLQFGVIGENLAFAPDVYLAHQGLMNSEGHRANILGNDWNTIGIGVVDGGVYGRMFVQLFSD